jgi:hypothetical protein
MGSQLIFPPKMGDHAHYTFWILRILLLKTRCSRRLKLNISPRAIACESLGFLTFDPGERVRTGPGFADDFFQVLFARQLEESLPVAIEVLHVQRVRVVRRNQPA